MNAVMRDLNLATGIRHGEPYQPAGYGFGVVEVGQESRSRRIQHPNWPQAEGLFQTAEDTSARIRT
jgi:hypothetical protein